ncbi:hypothetical protein [Brevibacillus laterosporus]|uniref:hypothetical protein n=1 Tax=Brevibacillus laterosporus TaxID=1465 RepID=UPI00264D1C18|nr:hypothetical protein [Brevibacillus laterosporus]MDN9010478.1 hypothetical protein [Brevibacillus laterosporus]MDO0941613.1 hypothetical protein [Brevibacillus laterosporus]
MSLVKLSQNEALMIEVLRAKGVTDEELLDALKKEDISDFLQCSDDFDFSQLLDFSRQNWCELEQAVREGYQIKFNTINGIKYLISVRLNQVADRDYQNKGDYLAEIKLKEAEVIWLQSVLSKNWTVVEQKQDPKQDPKQDQNSELKVIQIKLVRS